MSAAFLSALGFLMEHNVYVASGTRRNCFDGYSFDWRFEVRAAHMPESVSIHGGEVEIMDLARKLDWKPEPEIQEQLDREHLFIRRILDDTARRRGEER